jgi:hypothetical protein
VPIDASLNRRYGKSEKLKPPKYQTRARLNKPHVLASRLYLIAEALGVGIGLFYGLDDAAAGIDTAAVAGSIGLLGRAVRDRGPRMFPRHDARTAQHLR